MVVTLITAVPTIPGPLIMGTGFTAIIGITIITIINVTGWV